MNDILVCRAMLFLWERAGAAAHGVRSFPAYGTSIMRLLRLNAHFAALVSV